ncbi:MAG TPA: hypothetical protein PKY96_12225, partial [Flavobacteriales bacterium]|nr:hypothetical protein [Flavobacteriales bacterium]
MSLHDQFDELARQKLEERAFPFDEGAWQQAQQAIAAQKRNRRKPFWYLGGAAAVGVALWLLWPNAEEVRMAEQPRVESKTEAAAMQAVDQGSAAVIERADEVQFESAAVKQAPKQALRSSQIGSSRSDAMPKAEDPVLPARVLNSSAQHPREAHVHVAEQKVNDAQSTEAAGGTGVSDAAMGSQEATTMDQIVVKHDPEQVALEDVSEGQVEDAVLVVNDERSDAHAVESPSKTDAQATNEKGESQPISTGSSVNEVPRHELVRAAVAAGETRAPEDSVQAAPALASTLLPFDSAAAAVPEPSLLPLVGARSPWEVTALFGAFSTSSKYVLPQVKDWTSTPERTPGYAVEAVRMGRNFGVGLGLHYGSYADRLATPEASRTEVAYSRYWFLQAVDTTLLIITGGDSASGFTGINVPATVQVLRSAFDTTTTTTLIRAARTQLIRTSYVEMPILLDAHLVQGRWSIGVRGGPTIGMLTARSGALPGNGEGGYTDLGGMAVRQTIFGWTARAYVRYRFNSAWSIGIEPAARGQLSDGLASP